MKKLICLVTGAAVILGTSSMQATKAAEISNSIPKTYSSSSVVTLPRTITLEEALDSIETVNPEINLMDKKIDLLNAQYEKDKGLSSFPDGEIDTVDYDLQQKYNFKESLNNLNSAKSDRAERIKAIKNDLKKQYLNALCDQKDIDIINKSIENLDNKIKIQNTKINAGIATENSVESLNTQKSNLQTSLNQLNTQLQSELLTIRQYLNLNMSQQITLTDTSEDYVKFDDSNIDEKIQTAVDKNPDIIKQQNSLDLLKTKTAIYMKHYSKYENQVKGFQININQSRMSLDNLELDTKIGLWKSYYNLKNAENSVDAEKANLENVENDVKIAEKSYEVGSTDKTAVDDSNTALEQQKNKLERAADSYMVILENFENSLGE
ncbi:TolC family protein [Clostridium tyrobutyricum]|uniref:TolC family protein n=1 Tax=Clostridium tyrobutyricum TaxID=1519 RepID=UPI001C387871|nr:TolC family protein [Clostridium tyrobutyricum]MBV4421636.1 TolC family protein [Clostridium tyrobutyricum]